MHREFREIEMSNEKPRLSIASAVTSLAYKREEMALQLDDDWSFASLKPSETLWGPHGYHRYPAKFIPQLVRRIIDCYSAPGDLVGDTFVGSATTAIEALRSGRRFWGSDINTVALLIGRAKSIPLSPQKLNDAWEKVSKQLKNIRRIGRRPLTPEEIRNILAINISHATAEERLNYWFPAEHRQLLECILQEILLISDEYIRIFFLCGFSNILRRSSIWLSGSTKPQKDLKKYLSDPVEEFHRQIRDMIRRNELYWFDLKAAGVNPHLAADACCLVHADAQRLPLTAGELDLLVTSPPYATCYEYNDLHQLTELWFTRYHILPPNPMDASYIGTKGVSKRSSSPTSATSTKSQQADAALAQLATLATGSTASAILREIRQLQYYFQDMYNVICESARVISPGKRMVLIIGNSRRRGITIPTSAALDEMASTTGFELEQRIVRKVAGRILVSTRDPRTGRFSSNTQTDSQAYPEEDILIFRKLSD
jgi:DNA modification methylase